MSHTAMLEDARSAPRDRPALIHKLTEWVRRVEIGSIASDTGLASRLEVRASDGRWHTIVLYEMFDDVCLRHEYRQDGARKTIRVDLPMTVVKEMAETEILMNWKYYVERFIAGRNITY